MMFDKFLSTLRLRALGRPQFAPSASVVELLMTDLLDVCRDGMRGRRPPGPSSRTSHPSTSKNICRICISLLPDRNIELPVLYPHDCRRDFADAVRRSEAELHCAGELSCDPICSERCDAHQHLLRRILRERTHGLFEHDTTIVAGGGVGARQFVVPLLDREIETQAQLGLCVLVARGGRE